MNPPKPCTGTSAQAAWNNQLLAFCVSLRILAGRGYRRHQYPKGLVLDIDTGHGGASESSIGRYHLKSVQGDYITCRTWDGTSEGTSDIFIAKPYKLRESLLSELKLGTTYNYSYANTAGDGLNPQGLSNNRTRTSLGVTAADTRQELVVPLWVVGAAGVVGGDEILAVKASLPEILGGDGKPVSRIMIQDRNWADVSAP